MSSSVKLVSAITFVRAPSALTWRVAAIPSSRGSDQCAFGHLLRAQLGNQCLHFGERAPGQLVQPIQLSPHPTGIAIQQQQCRLRGEGHAENGLRHRIVQLAHQAMALLRHGQLLQLFGIGLQLAVGDLQFLHQRLVLGARRLGTPGSQGVGGQQGVRGGVDQGKGQPACGAEAVHEWPGHQWRKQSNPDRTRPGVKALHDLQAENGEQDCKIIHVRDEQECQDQARLEDQVDRKILVPPTGDGRLAGEQDQPGHQHSQHLA